MKRYAAVLIIPAIVLFASTMAMAAQNTLRMSSWLPPGHPIVKGMMVPWAKNVEKATKGRVKVVILPSSLGPPPAHFDIARDGIADLTYGVHGYTPGRFLLTRVAELPFLSDSAETLSVAYWRTHEKYLVANDEHKGVVALSVFTHGPGMIYNSKRPITKASDLDGLKIRVGGGAINEISKKLGIVTIHAPAPKSYEILSRGVADGIMFPQESVPSFKLERVLKYMTVVPKGLYNTSFFLVANPKTFKALPKADRDAIWSVSGEAFARLAGKAWDAADAHGFKVTKASGIKIDYFKGAALKELARRVAFSETDWLKAAKGRGIDSEAALKYLRAQIARAR